MFTSILQYSVVSVWNMLQHKDSLPCSFASEYIVRQNGLRIQHHQASHRSSKTSLWISNLFTRSQHTYPEVNGLVTIECFLGCVESSEMSSLVMWLFYNSPVKRMRFTAMNCMVTFACMAYPYFTKPLKIRKCNIAICFYILWSDVCE